MNPYFTQSKYPVIFVIALLGTLITGTAQAKQCWSVMPATCQLDYRTLDDKNFIQAWGGLKFRGARTGYIRFHCPMPVEYPASGGSYEVQVWHENAVSSNDFIALQLRRLYKRSILNVVSFNTRDNISDLIPGYSDYYRTYSNRFAMPEGENAYVLQGYIYRSDTNYYPAMRLILVCKVF